MSNYGFEATRASNGSLIRGVTITHDPEVCHGYGIPCGMGIQTTTTHSTGLATMGFTDQAEHYFTATYPGQPAVQTNIYTTGMNRVRYIEFIFNHL